MNIHDAEHIAADVTALLQPIADYTSVVFRDLVDLAQRNARVFDELYYGRETESTLFQTLIEDAQRTAVNVLIVGDAGTGKSNFIYKLVRHTEVLDSLNIYPITVDYRTRMPSNANGCLIQFIRDVQDYFEAIQQPIHTLKDLTDGMITLNMQLCHQHLEAIPKEHIGKHLLVILDDFDYAEDEWFTMLDFFLPFAASTKASVVFTLRPLLLATVEKFDDRFTHYYVRNCQQIELSSMDVSRILATRIALLLSVRNDRSLYARIRNRIRANCHGLMDILRQMGIGNPDSLPQFEYPFTEKHNMFMRRITNGNLREVFDIAMDTLVYMFDPRNPVQLRTEHDIERRSIGREGDMRLFLDTYDRKLTPYRMLNLHRQRSRNGNSLLYNILELVKLRRVVDDTFYDMAKRYGHLARDVDYALGELSDKTNRMICPARLRPGKQTTLQYDVPEYYTTDKGDYYLQICEWDEYRARCGASKVSIQKEYKP